ncbi:hypothetical protein HHK36_005641 [Tetracentron sinense]|uniref:Uncharacterized protein n=1 Tax=Tetracentron sinense TaxID=13715 RepID=A0A835DMH9_TETSI|nr:hypothetical protein HHK36_005641 [Tetracentron sinense]
MVELQSCASLVNASALCARSRGCSLDCSAPLGPLDYEEREVKGESGSVVAEILAELQREKQKNAELMERISLLEAQIKEREKISLLTDRQESCPSATEKSFKKFKRHKVEPRSDEVEEADITKSDEMATQIKHDTLCMAPKNVNREDCLVNWMSMDETHFLHSDKFKDNESAADYEDTDDSDDEDDEYCEEDGPVVDDKDRENDENSQIVDSLKGHLHEEGPDGGKHIQFLERPPNGQTEPILLNVNQAINEDQNQGCLLPDTGFMNNKRELKKLNRKESKKIRGYKVSSEIHTSEQEIGHKGSGSVPLHKKPPKVAFCPKEVKRLMELETLLWKDAQSHTIRKIIVFASLGIRHGCEDMYELDFNHFSILRKGEPYVSPQNPGEHVLYENPGIRRKVFYPNRQNPTLCPVRILEEEKAMRPSDSSCPSCLFLCIKYGGRTRNIPQNEYVRQRMGRNKLKSFGLLMCQMAMLVHIRCGSFFFKALGITLLFMAGFPDDLVQRETKYRNLDLLQKYYRTDEDTKGEELFHLYPMTYDTASPRSLQLARKAGSKKSSGKTQTTSISKLQNFSTPSTVQPVPLSSVSPTQFGLMGYTPIHTNTMGAFQSMPSHTPTDPPSSNPAITSPSPTVSYHRPPPYPIFPPYPANTFMPMPYWHHTNAFPSCPYPSSYGYRSLPPSASYISLHPQPYYGNPSCIPFMLQKVEDTGKKTEALEEADSDSGSSSSSTEQKWN